ncbi:GNAT family N-acetyltransferase [Flavobacterium hauense]
MYSIKRYVKENLNQWNGFIAKSKNGTFLFHRDFMEYHRDRFEDYSLMVFNEDKLIAVLPAHKTGSDLYSHFGLTYGGLLYSEKAKLTDIIRVFGAILAYLHENAIENLHVKLIPSIYHKYPADEFSYALFVAGASINRKDSLAVVDQKNRIPFSTLRKRTIKKGKENNYIIKEETDFRPFWEEVLIPNLLKKHNANPVHTIEEITLLHQKFPDNIKQFSVYKDGLIVAGTTVFITDTVAHMQYISGKEEYNDLGALDFLYDYLINKAFIDKRFFDLGTSNEAQGTKLNEGLMFWKEGFGARTIIQDFYVVETANYKLLDNVLI